VSAPLEFADVPTQIGTFRIAYLGRTVRVIDLLEQGRPQTGTPLGAVRRKPPFPSASPPRQLQEYFRGARTAFDLDVEPDTASDFDRKVWKLLRGVPAGKTISYSELARKAGHPGSARAVGGSMARNPIPIVIPCHRVVDHRLRARPLEEALATRPRRRLADPVPVRRGTAPPRAADPRRDVRCPPPERALT